MAMAVLVLNLTVLAMNHQFRLLVLRNLPGAIHRILLAVENLGVSLGAGTPDCPTTFTGNHMLIALAHIDVPCRGGSAAIWVCGRQIRRGHSQTLVRVENHDRTHKSQGGAVPTKSPSERHANIEELSRALMMLTVAERLRLFARARLLVWGTEYTDPQELLNEAVKRALVAASGSKQDGERGRPWPIDRVPLPAFLSGCMDSIADTSRESVAQTQTDRLEALAGEGGNVDTVIHRAGRWNADVVEQAIEVEDTLDRQQRARADAQIIETHFKDDQEVLAVIEGEKADLPVAEVLALFDLDQRTYDTARRRLRRQMDKLMPGRSKR